MKIIRKYVGELRYAPMYACDTVPTQEFLLGSTRNDWYVGFLEVVIDGVKFAAKAYVHDIEASAFRGDIGREMERRLKQQIINAIGERLFA